MFDIDVIVPVLNGGERFISCLKALQAQEGVHSRLIVVDNGSSDSSKELAARFGAVVLEERKRSSYAARNTGLAAATAPVVAFTDADCVPASNWLSAGLKVLKRSGWNLCAGDISQEPGKSVAGRHDELTYLHQETHVRNMGFGATANLFVQRSVFDAIGLFDARLRSGGDLDFGRRARRAGFILGYSSETVVSHCPREGLGQVLAKAWNLGVGQAQVGRQDLLLLRWGLSPRRLLPGPDILRCSWKHPSVILVEVLVKWAGWAARVATLIGIAAGRNEENSFPLKRPLLMVSSWWPTVASPHERPFVVDHARALQDAAVDGLECWAVVPGVRAWKSRPLKSCISGCALKSKVPRVPWRISLGSPGIALLLLAGWMSARRRGVHPRAVVLQSFSYAGPYAVGLARGFKCPLIYVEHWSAVALRELTAREVDVLRMVLSASHRVLAVSRYLASELEEIGGLEQGSVGVVENVVDPSLFAPTAQPEHPGTVIAHVADFRPVKDHGLLVDALLTIGADELERLDLRFVLVGEGPLRASVQQRLAAFPAIARRVRFTGKLPRAAVAAQMAAADWTMLTSRVETSSCVAREALSIGRPVIAPSVGALPELLHLGDGILYERSVSGLAKALVEAGSHRDCESWESRAAAAASRFGPDVLAQSYRQLLAEVLSCPGQ